MWLDIKTIAYRAFFIAIWKQANQREKTCGLCTSPTQKKSTTLVASKVKKISGGILNRGTGEAKGRILVVQVLYSSSNEGEPTSLYVVSFPSF